MPTLTTLRDVVSSVPNYFLFDADPSVTSIGFDADVGSLLIRTDVPSLYFKSAAGVLSWILAGVGSVIATGPSNSCITFQEGGLGVGPTVFNTWAGVMGELAALRAVNNGVGCYTIIFDNTFVFPGPMTIPAGGPYDMTDVTLQGRQQFTQATPSDNWVQIADGASFVGLRSITYLRLENLNTIAAADSSLGVLESELVKILYGASVYCSGGASLWDTPAMVPGTVIGFFVEASDIGTSGIGAIVNMANAGTIVSTFPSFGGVIGSSFLSGVAGSVLFLSRTASSSQIAATFPAFGGVTAVNDAWAVASLRPDPFNAAPYAGFVTLVLGALARFTTTGGSVTQPLPDIIPTSPDYIGGMISISNVSDTIGAGGVLMVTPGAGNTIMGSPSGVFVPRGGTVVFASDGISDWIILSMTGTAGTGGGAPISNALCFQPGGGGQGPVVFEDWTMLLTQLAQMRVASGTTTGVSTHCAGQYAIIFDDTFITPALVPFAGGAGSADMRDVVWLGRDANYGTFVECEDGVTFTNLREFGHNLSVRSLSDSPIVGDLVGGDNIRIRDFTNLETIVGGAPFFDASGVGAGDLVFVIMTEQSSFGYYVNGPNFNFPNAGSILLLSTFDGSLENPETFSGAAGSLLIINPDSLGNISTVFPSWAGTIQKPSVWIPPSLTPNPYLTTPATAPFAANFNEWLRFDASGGAIAQTLPSIGGLFFTLSHPGCFVTVSEEGGGLVSVSPAAGETIDGSASAVPVPPNGMITFIGDGVSNWNQFSKSNGDSGIIVWKNGITWEAIYAQIVAANGPVIVLVEFDAAVGWRVMTNNGGAPTNLWNVQFQALSHNGWNIPASFRVVTIRVDDGFLLGVDPDSGFAILLSQNIEWEFDTSSGPTPIVSGDPCYFEINGGKLATSGADSLTVTDTFYLEVSNNSRMLANNELTGDASRVAVLTGAQLNGTFSTTTGAHTLDVFVDALSQISGVAFGAGITPTYFGSAVYLVSPDGTEWTGTVDNFGVLTFA